MMEDFRNSDRYFKYKAGVLAGWLFLTVSSFGVACPGQGPSNDIDAHLIPGVAGAEYLRLDVEEHRCLLAARLTAGLPKPSDLWEVGHGPAVLAPT